MVLLDYSPFWTYYKATVKKDYSMYRQKFWNALTASCNVCGVNMNYSGDMLKNMTKILTKTKTFMLSNGVPSDATTHLIKYFKKWFQEMYG